MTWARRVDRTHRPVKAALESCGWLVADTSRLGGDFPDLVAYHRGLDRIVLVEVKAATGKLTRGQSAFAARWPVQVLRSADEALDLHRQIAQRG